MAVDSTGKVGNKDILGESEATKLLRTKLNQTTAALDSNKAGKTDTGALLDKVNIDIAKAINQQMNPAVLLSERSDKVARIKELVAKGEYNPSSDAIARAVGEEIVQEILFAGDTSGIPGDDEK